MSITLNRICEDLYLDLNRYSNGLWVTLDNTNHTKYKFEYLVAELIKRLNRYCYGKGYVKSATNRLRSVGGIETGVFNDGLHIHLIIMYGIIRRDFPDLELFIRKEWYKIIEAKGSFFGTMVDVQPVNNLRTRIEYMCKSYYESRKEFNPTYF